MQAILRRGNKAHAVAMQRMSAWMARHVRRVATLRAPLPITDFRPFRTRLRASSSAWTKICCGWQLLDNCQMQAILRRGNKAHAVAMQRARARGWLGMCDEDLLRSAAIIRRKLQHLQTVQDDAFYFAAEEFGSTDINVDQTTVIHSIMELQ